MPACAVSFCCHSGTASVQRTRIPRRTRVFRLLDQQETNHTSADAPEPRGEDGAIRSEYVQEVTTAIDAADATRLRTLVGDLHEFDLGSLLEALDPESRPRLITLMGADFDFSALTQVDDTVREEILEELTTKTVAEGVRELDSDDAVWILQDLPKDEQTEILDQLPSRERLALRRNLDYPEESAGRRMQDEFIAVPPSWTVGRVMDYLSETAELPERFLELYVVDPGYRLLGAVALDRLLRAKRPIPVSNIMDEERRRVRATEDQEEVARLFERYDLVAVPVVDEQDRLVGVVTVDDVVDVIEEEAEEDIKALGGVTGDEELSDSSLDHRARPVSLAACKSDDRVARVLGDPSVRGLAAEDGGARGADADRRQHGRQCRNPNHDGCGARACYPRPQPRQRLARDPARTRGRAAQRHGVCLDHGDGRRRLVQYQRSGPGDRAGDGVRARRRGARRDPDSAAAHAAWR